MDNSYDEISKVSREEWKKIMPRYRGQQKEWVMISNIFWLILIVASSVFIYHVQNWWSIIGIIIGFYSAAQLGSRSGNIDGFQIGYEWGKEEAIQQVQNFTSVEININEKN